MTDASARPAKLYGNAHTRTTLWLGTDDGDPDGMSGHGFEVRTEDNMVAVITTLEDDRGADLEVFICRDLFPPIRAAMKAIDARFGEMERDRIQEAAGDAIDELPESPYRDLIATALRGFADHLTAAGVP